jgi:hypothetical protein
MIAFAHPYIILQSVVAFSSSSLRLKKTKRRKGDFLGVESVASPSLSSHGGTRLDPFQGYIGEPTEPPEARDHDGGGTRNLQHARRPRVPHIGRCHGFMTGFESRGAHGHESIDRSMPPCR